MESKFDTLLATITKEQKLACELEVQISQTRHRISSQMKYSNSLKEEEVR